MARPASKEYKYFEDPLNVRFRELRTLLNLNQREFCEKLGLRQTTVSDIERGRLKVSSEVISKIITEFNVNVGWFYFMELPIFKETKGGSQVGFTGGAEVKHELPNQQSENQAVRLSAFNYIKNYHTLISHLFDNETGDSGFIEFNSNIDTLIQFSWFWNTAVKPENFINILNIKYKNDVTPRNYTERALLEIERMRPFFPVFKQFVDAILEFSKELQNIPEDLLCIDRELLSDFLLLAKLKPQPHPFKAVKRKKVRKS